MSYLLFTTYKIAYLVVSLETPIETNYHQSLRIKIYFHLIIVTSYACWTGNGVQSLCADMPPNTCTFNFTVLAGISKCYRFNVFSIQPLNCCVYNDRNYIVRLAYTNMVIAFNCYILDLIVKRK